MKAIHALIFTCVCLAAAGLGYWLGDINLSWTSLVGAVIFFILMEGAFFVWLTDELDAHKVIQGKRTKYERLKQDTKTRPMDEDELEQQQRDLSK
jgi:hypothetical protein